MNGDGERGGVTERVVASENTVAQIARDVAVAVGTVVGLLLFATSGVWPPLVAVESGSMEPHLQRGDVVYVSEPGRYAPGDGVRGTGVVTLEAAGETGYQSIQRPGSVVVYERPGATGSPIIHRAVFWVEEGENWYDEADSDHLRADGCRELANCPAPNAGFVTKGDANGFYDQAAGVRPVRPEWIRGTAHGRVPHLGRIRLLLGFTSVGQ
ncbi:S26 family signal peptidase [Halomicrobium urmianum]|uniref:S26 family signal peptidase n=1 Tax=Halomicrobium urmianum TaxID=1586233 RepID=UPI001CD95979|nr:S26 family signal peptidase [Halomicrobium urmianum]